MASAFVIWQEPPFRVVARPKTAETDSRVVADWTFCFEGTDGVDALGTQRWREAVNTKEIEVLYAVTLAYLAKLLKEWPNA